MGITFEPQEGFQTRSLACSTDIALLGGTAGASKTWTLLLDSLRWIKYPSYKGVFFRRHDKSFKSSGGLWQTTNEIYPYFGGRLNKQDKIWTFPSGAIIQLKNVDESRGMAEMESLKGMECSVAYIDEITEFSERMVWWIQHRIRDSKTPLRPYSRWTSNAKDCWLARFIEWYLDKDKYVDLEKSGKVRYFVNNQGQRMWADSKEELLKYTDDARKIISFTFIHGTIMDNKILIDNNPGYLAALQNLPEVDRKRILNGWWGEDDEKTLFKKDWFNWYTDLPQEFQHYFITIDTAAKTDDVHDYSAATVWGYNPPIGREIGIGELFLIDMIHGKWDAFELQERIGALIKKYYMNIVLKGKVFIEDANIGTALYTYLKRDFREMSNKIKTIHRSRGNAKYMRAKNVQAFIYQGGIFLPKKEVFSNTFIEEVCSFSPDDSHEHDDITDTMMDAITEAEKTHITCIKPISSYNLSRVNY